MAKIEKIITKQAFEIVRDLIGAILKTELENQKTLQAFDDVINIYTGRSSSYHQNEKLMINVDVESGVYEPPHAKGVQGDIDYYVDVYVTSIETAEKKGGQISTEKRDKFLGMCRYIIQDHHYQKLGLPPGLVLGVHVKGFENFEPQNSNDSSFFKMSRLKIGVKMYEEQSLWDGVDISSIFTDVKLEATDKGYKYEYEIPE